jgi:hypothetical protein
VETTVLSVLSLVGIIKKGKLRIKELADLMIF